MRAKHWAVATSTVVVSAVAGVGVAALTAHRPPARSDTVTSQPAADPIVAAAPADSPRLYWPTPQAAMRYLAAAWNRHDTVALMHVTTPAGRGALEAMRSEAVNLRLRACTRNPAGDYTCVFDHDYPASMHKRGHGTATFIAGPAREHGWYMTYFEGCG